MCSSMCWRWAVVRRARLARTLASRRNTLDFHVEGEHPRETVSDKRLRMFTENQSAVLDLVFAIDGVFGS